MRIKHFLILTICLLIVNVNFKAQELLSIDQCRLLAIENNRSLKIASEEKKVADLEKRQALLQYFPKFSASGTYLHFSKDLHLIGKSSIPSEIPIPPLNTTIQIPEAWQDAIYKAGEIDMSGFWMAGVSLTQPIFTGGKIIALNDIRSYAQELAVVKQDSKLTDLVVEVDEAYWQVVSISKKTELANSLVGLLSQMESDVQKMLDEGVATKADKLSVDVKLNEAEVAQTKADNGLRLAKMLLCQICGLDIMSNINLEDEKNMNTATTMPMRMGTNIEFAVENRDEIKSLDLATKIYKRQERIARAEFMPTAGVSVGYNWMKPNLQDGVQDKFGGMLNVAVSVKVPLNFITSSAKVKVAKSQTQIMHYQMEDAKEKIRLQINQSMFKVEEAERQVRASAKNIDKANENLRYANVGFKEGVIPSSDALSAHTAWVSAQSDLIESQINLKLCQLYLSKALGETLINK